MVQSNSTDLRKDQLVFRRLDRPTTYGTLAEYTIAGPDIAVVPEGVDATSAAAVGTAGITAYQCLRIGGLRPGSKVFINGGSGGAGTWGIQLARAMGFEVTTSCSTRNINLCRIFGANQIIDYTNEDLIGTLKSKGHYYDLVVDNVGEPSNLYKEADHFLKPGCPFVQIGVAKSAYGFCNVLGRKGLPSALGNGSRPWVYHHAKSQRADLEQIGQWLAEKKIKAVVDSEFSWEDAPQAYGRFKTGKAQGRVIVHVEASD